LTYSPNITYVSSFTGHFSPLWLGCGSQYGLYWRYTNVPIEIINKIAICFLVSSNQMTQTFGLVNIPLKKSPTEPAFPIRSAMLVTSSVLGLKGYSSITS
jgi:hypothetical protein